MQSICFGQYATHRAHHVPENNKRSSAGNAVLGRLSTWQGMWLRACLLFARPQAAVTKARRKQAEEEIAGATAGKLQSASRGRARSMKLGSASRCATVQPSR